jgi:hypothetical protein
VLRRSLLFAKIPIKAVRLGEKSVNSLTFWPLKRQFLNLLRECGAFVPNVRQNTFETNEVMKVIGNIRMKYIRIFG